MRSAWHLWRAFWIEWRLFWRPEWQAGHLGGSCHQCPEVLAPGRGKEENEGAQSVVLGL
jgi:hypothetical protein